MNKEHHYPVKIEWTGNKGKGTRNYRAYERDHTVSVKGKTPILCSSDPAFRGDPQRYNPEEQLVASISSCHMLWYLHLCASAKIVVVEYRDDAIGTMIENADGSGQFGEVTLRPKIKIEGEQDIERALALHHQAHQMCFIANSVNFPVSHEPEIVSVPSAINSKDPLF